MTGIIYHPHADEISKSLVVGSNPFKAIIIWAAAGPSGYALNRRASTGFCATLQLIDFVSNVLQEELGCG
ncbi:hypothetical protein AS026_05330 [Rhizobium altiplani]|uniref:Uncharacterized protein n=1 Tax=Rhizobium altiplani TaxID=1864509 RepID=A0A109JN61_9HYPH|nr:hypothetical protein AS026_05330 [Rhizobium altiplani]